MGRRRRALLSDTGPLASVRQSQSQSQIYRRLSADISSERRAHLVQLVVQLSGLFERVQAEGAAGVGLLVGVPLHLIDRFSADALEHFPGTSRWSRRIVWRCRARPA